MWGKCSLLAACLILSGVNSEKFTGEINYHPFVPEASGGAWTVPLESISINGKILKFGVPAADATSATNATAPATKTSALASTAPSSNGTNAGGQNSAIVAGIRLSHFRQGVYIPRHMVDAFYADIPGLTITNVTAMPLYWMVPCDGIKDLDVRLTIGGKEYAMDSRDLLQQKAPDSLWNQKAVPVPSTPLCLLNIESSGT